MYFRNATFSREVDGLRNLNSAIDWFGSVRQQAMETGKTAIVDLLHLNVLTIG